jgi:ATP-dependent DNA ligase
LPVKRRDAELDDLSIETSAAPPLSKNLWVSGLLFRRGEPRYYAFDQLFRNGEDLCYLHLADRKHRLSDLISDNSERLLYCDHVEGMGEDMFHLICQRDLEGIVAKHKFDPYVPSHPG